MKKIIKDVLSDMSESQINLGSESAREMIASLVSAALKTKGEYTKHTNDKLEEQEARRTWVCSICGKNTYDIDWDYIGSGTNHLSCEVRLELDEEKRKKNDYVYSGDLNNKVQAKSPYNDGWTRKYYKEKENAKQLIDKLSEDIVPNNDTGYIYETPDGGKTVFRRDVGSDKRELVENWEELKKE